MACAWGGFAGYGIAMLMSFFIGQKKYPIRYDLRTMGRFLLLGVLMYLVYRGLEGFIPSWACVVVGSVMLLGYLLLVYKEIKRNR